MLRCIFRYLAEFLPWEIKLELRNDERLEIHTLSGPIIGAKSVYLMRHPT
jgi:hypothetical protein